MVMLVDCSNCRTPLQLPPGAATIRCAVCKSITRVGDPRTNTPAPPSYLPTHSNGHYPPQYSYAPRPGPSSTAHLRKKAVIVGISYRYSRHELKWTINDARCMKYLLINRFKFPESSILMLTELGVMYGKTIVLVQVHGKALMEGKSYPLVVVMMIKYQQIHLLCPR